MRRKLLGLLAGAATMALVGCTPATSGSSGGSGESSHDVASQSDSASAECEVRKDEVALFMTHMSNEFTIMLSGAVEAEAKELGMEYKLYDAGKDAAKQQSQIEQAVGLNVGAIIIEPVSVDGILPAVKTASDAGIPVIIVNQRISDPTLADAYVGADAIVTGAKLMEYVVEENGESADVALLLGPMGSDGQVGRSAGFQEVLDANPGYQVVFEGAADWETAPALTLTENWLNAGKTINAIVSQNDGMAIGAATAVSDKNLQGEVLVYGVDATSEGLQAVLDGKLSATISQGTEDQGKISAQYAYDLIHCETVPEETIVDNVIYTKDNAQEALDAIKGS